MINNIDKDFSDIEKVNYYNDKIRSNILICRIRSVIYAIALIVSYLLALNNNDNSIYMYIFYTLIVSYMILWLITFKSRNKYINNLLNVAKNDSFVMCEKCKKYKYTADKCDECGNSKILSKEEKKELLDKYRKTKELLVTLRTVFTILVIIAEIVAIIMFVKAPSEILTNYSTVYLVNCLYYGFLIIASIIVTCIVLFFIVNNSSYIIKRYIIKIELLKDASDIK